MKKTKLAVIFAALVSVLGFTSCLESEGSSNYPTFQAAVTITGDKLLGYTFYCDAGENIKLQPTTESVANLNLDGVKRAVIGFDLADDYTGVTQLQPNTTYTVIVNSLPYYTYGIPTYTMVVDTLSSQYQSAGNDSIAVKGKQISSADTNSFYVKNGYMTFYPRFNYGTSPLYFGLYYDGEKDVDAAKGSLNMNLYFNNSVDGSYAMSSAASVISMKMPVELYNKFMQSGKDSIDVTLNLNASTNQSPLKCRMAVSDFMTPMAY